MKFLQGCMGCMGCMSGIGCYNNPSALAGTVRMSDSADGCGACMGCMRGTGCMNSFGLHGLGMGRMVRSFDTLGTVMPATLTLGMSKEDIQKVVQNILSTTTSLNRLVGALHQKLNDPKSAVGYNYNAIKNTIFKDAASVKAAQKGLEAPYFVITIILGDTAQRLSNAIDFNSFLYESKIDPMTENKKTFGQVVGMFFNRLESMSAKTPSTSSAGGGVKIDVRSTERTSTTQTTSRTDAQTSRPSAPPTRNTGSSSLPEEGVRRIAPQVNADQTPNLDDQSTMAKNVPTESITEQKQGLSGTQIGLIAAGGVGILGVAWYFMSKGKN